MANQFSVAVRQGLLLHEISYARKKPQSPVIGKPIGRKEIEELQVNPKEFMPHLRKLTLDLKP